MLRHHSASDLEKNILKIFIVTLFSTSSAFAGEIYREYRSARHLGMGDAGIATPNGYDAIFYNPAGISDTKGLLNEVVVASPSASVSANAKGIAQEIQSGGAAEDPMKFGLSNVNKPIHADVSNFTGVVFRRSAFGVLTDTEMNALIGYDPVTGLPTASAGAAGNAKAYLTVARGFFSDHLLVGANVKYGAKVGFDYVLPSVLKINEISSVNPSDLQKRGLGGGADIGIIFKSSAKSSPRVGLTIHNIGGVSYAAMESGTGAPESDPQIVDVGISVEPQTKSSKMLLAADLKDATNRSSSVIYNRIHLGGELTFSDIIGVSGGLNQGYPTYGALLNFKVVRIEGGIYTEEFGDKPGRIPDKRYFGRISLGWLQ